MTRLTNSNIPINYIPVTSAHRSLFRIHYEAANDMSEERSNILSSHETAMLSRSFSPVRETILIQHFNYTLVISLMKITKSVIETDTQTGQKVQLSIAVSLHTTPVQWRSWNIHLVAIVSCPVNFLDLHESQQWGRRPVTMVMVKWYMVPDWLVDW